MLSRVEMRSAKCVPRKEDFQISEIHRRDWRFNRDMYFKVGQQWKWIDKRPWTNQQWKEYAGDPNLRTFAGYCGDEISGYYELKRTTVAEQTTSGCVPRARDYGAIRAAAAAGEVNSQDSKTAGHTSDVTCHAAEVEIAYFGLLPEFIGRGFGGVLLTSAIENAWSWSAIPSRVWVHTCNRDHPSALANYQARGFKIYKTVSDLAI